MDRRHSLALLHGFLGGPHDWSNVFPSPIKSVAVDWAPHLANLERPADGQWLANLAAKLNADLNGKADQLIGYSMGGRIGMHMLLSPSGAFWKSAVIVSASTGLASVTEKERRTEADRAWAARFKSDNWNTVVEDWNNQPVFAGEPEGAPTRPEMEAQRKQVSIVMERGSVGLQDDLTGRLTEIKIPVLWVAGENDSKYAALARRYSSLGAQFESAILPDCGHRAPFTQPQRFAQVVAAWSNSIKHQNE